MEKGTNLSPTNNIPCGVEVVTKVESKNLTSQNHCPFKSSFSSIDTLSVNLWLEWFHPDFFILLETKSTLAKEIDIDSVPIDFANKSWNVHRFAPGYFKYHISSGDLNIYLSNHSYDGRIANCKIDIGSLSCWGGTEECFDLLVDSLQSHGCNLKREVVGRGDLCTDHVGLNIQDLQIDNEDLWICRATKFTTIRENRKLSHIAYGKGNMMLRIYDKTLELKTKKATNKQLEFAKIWGLKKYDDKPTTRAEFQFRRKIIREFESASGEKLGTVAEFLNGLQSLWGYATGSWARHNSQRVDRSNKNQKRVSLSNYWKSIQEVDWKTSLAVTRKVGKVRKNMDSLAEQMRGLMITMVSAEGLNVDDYFGIMGKAKEILSLEMDKYMVEDYSKFYHKYNMRQNEALVALS